MTGGLRKHGRRHRHTSPLVLGGIVTVAPAGFPLWLAVATAGRPRPAPPTPSAWPGISVVIAAYREAAVIGAKIDDVRRNGYPGELEIIIVADDPDSADRARDAGARVIGPGERQGKASAVNRGVAAASQPIVVLTDADAHLDGGSLAALARWFADDRIGAVAGEKRVAGMGQSLYWRFESWIKERESRLGTTIGLVGELAAFRRSTFRPVPIDVVVDDLWIGLDVVEDGMQVRYEPDAVAVETGVDTLAAEWQRRTRTQAGLIDLLWRRRGMLVPRASPVAAQLWGHKLMRTVFGPIAHALLLLSAAARVRSSRISRILLAAHLAAAIALWRSTRGARLSRPEQAAVQVLFMQATALGAIWRYITGDRPSSWPKPERMETSGRVFDGPWPDQSN